MNGSLKEPTFRDARMKSIIAGRAQAIDATKLVRVDRLALAIDHNPPFVGEPHSRGAHILQVIAPPERVLASRLREGLRGVGWADGAGGAGFEAQGKDRFEQRIWRIGAGHFVFMICVAQAVKRNDAVRHAFTRTI
jgi:hypothetical protein